MNDSVRTLVIGVLIAVVPLLFAANAWQSYRFVQTERAVDEMQREHMALLEENTRLIVGIAGLRSPDRIRALALDDLGMSPLQAEQIRRIDIVGERGAN